MADYHVFSSENLSDWTDHGVIVNQKNVPWVDSTSYSMWAPDCVTRHGKYYFYFPANTKVEDENGRKGFGIGVAVADRPEGPYVPMPEPIKGVKGIDPNVFIDSDGQAYLIWALGEMYMARLDEQMCALATEPEVIQHLPDKGLKEGPFMFERKGKYYLTYPHVEKNTERIEYAMADAPTGPFRVTGVIMDEAPNGCWTNHQSVVQFKNQWYLFYHQNDWSPHFDKNRSVRIDSLFFNPDGTIRKVLPTLRGVGLTKSSTKIQLDRYSCVSDSGTKVVSNDTTNYFEGWNIILENKNAWVKYNSVLFESDTNRWMTLRYKAPQGAVVGIRLRGTKWCYDHALKIPAANTWTIARIPLKGPKHGVYHLECENMQQNQIGIDWIRFE